MTHKSETIDALTTFADKLHAELTAIHNNDETLEECCLNVTHYLEEFEQRIIKHLHDIRLNCKEDLSRRISSLEKETKPDLPKRLDKEIARIHQFVADSDEHVFKLDGQLTKATTTVNDRITRLRKIVDQLQRDFVSFHKQLRHHSHPKGE